MNARKTSSHGFTLIELLVIFVKAEDGIRNTSVTGVQTCALPIPPEHRGEVLRLKGDRCLPEVTPPLVQRQRGRISDTGTISGRDQQHHCQRRCKLSTDPTYYGRRGLCVRPLWFHGLRLG